MKLVMEVKIDAVSARSRWPGLQAFMVAKLRGSTSRERANPARSFRYKLAWAEMIDRLVRDLPLDAMRAHAQRRIAWSVGANVGRRYGSAWPGEGLPPAEPIPQEIIDEVVGRARRTQYRRRCRAISPSPKLSARTSG